MTEPSPRKFFRFQIHLSTAIVMMFVAGALIWANLYHRNLPAIGYTVDSRGQRIKVVELSDEDFEKLERTSDGAWNISYYYGWPCDSLCLSGQVPHGHIGDDKYFRETTKKWRANGIITNAAIALFIFSAAYFLCEWLIRRRAARK